jgi:hypothetical protein
VFSTAEWGSDGGIAHDRSGFACGAPDLDRYIREHASQDVKRDVARVFVVARASKAKPRACAATTA